MNEGGNVQDSSKYVMQSLIAGSMPRIDAVKTKGYEKQRWGNMTLRGILPHYFAFPSGITEIGDTTHSFQITIEGRDAIMMRLIFSCDL